MRHTDVRRAHHDDIKVPAGTASFSPEALRRVLATTEVTGAAHFVERGRTVEDYRASIYVYFGRFLAGGDLHDLAKAILKTISLREYLHVPNDGI